MPIRDNLIRAFRDFRSDDPQTREKPEVVIARVNDALEKLTLTERQRNVEAARAYADVYYLGRHNQSVPLPTLEALKNLEKRSERLNAVDSARAILTNLGGPPTRETIQQAIERSVAERALAPQAAIAVKKMQELRAPGKAVGQEQVKPLRAQKFEAEVQKIGASDKKLEPAKTAAKDKQQTQHIGIGL